MTAQSYDFPRNRRLSLRCEIGRTPRLCLSIYGHRRLVVICLLLCAAWRGRLLTFEACKLALGFGQLLLKSFVCVQAGYGRAAG